MAKKILVAPLDWGLGHATRCIPIINEFLKKGCEVQIAGSGSALTLLKKEFTSLKFHELVSYQAEYSSRAPFMMKIIWQMPKFLVAIKKEHHQVERIIEREKINFVISDNRYGCWSAQAPSVIITHQVNILMSQAWKWLDGIINYGNRKQIRKFSECWIPDFPDGITGKMTNSFSVKAKFIGMLSRFEKMNLPIRYDVLALISGPEPQRTLFEKEIKSQLSKSGLKYFVVKGKPESENTLTVAEVNHLPAKELNAIIESSAIVISRSGYTTIMDLCKLGKKAIFVPTPGQTEQEYLAEELMKRKIVFSQPQSQFDLTIALVESKRYTGFEGFEDGTNLLSKTIDELLKS